jgi:hypothetical protein
MRVIGLAALLAIGLSLMPLAVQAQQAPLPSRDVRLLCCAAG